MFDGAGNSVIYCLEDSEGKTAAIQLTWTDSGGQVQFAPIVTLALRK
jgi:hypothetical protein